MVAFSSPPPSYGEGSGESLIAAFRIEEMASLVSQNQKGELLKGDSVSRFLFIALTFVLMTIASCPFHGWQSFQAFVLGTQVEDDLPYTLEKVYTWGSALEMVIGLLAGAALDIFGPTLTSAIGLTLFHISCLLLFPLMAMREGSLGESLRTVLLRHQSLAMVPWNAVLAMMFAAPNFTSMGWFILRSQIPANRLSALVAGTQYLSSMVSTYWWIISEKFPGYNWLILLLWTAGSTVIAILWTGAATKKEKSQSGPSGADEVELAWRGDGNPQKRWDAPDASDRRPAHLGGAPPAGWFALPPPRTYSPWKIYVYHLTNGFIELFASVWLVLFAYWYSTSIFLMTYYDSRFRSMLLTSIYSDLPDVPKNLIMLSSCMTITQAPLCFCFGEWISRVSPKQKTFIVSVLCFSCSLLYAFAFIFLTHFPYFSVICNGIAGAFVYGSKYWFTDACITGNLINTGVEQYGVITGSLQLVAGCSALLNLVPTEEHSSSFFNLSKMTFHSIASALAVSGLIPCIILIIMLWARLHSSPVKGGMMSSNTPSLDEGGRALYGVDYQRVNVSADPPHPLVNGLLESTSSSKI